MIIKTVDGNKRRDVPQLDDSGVALLDVTKPPGELGVNVYHQRAMQFAQNGNYSEALRELLLGSMSWAERAGHIRFRKGLTNRNYVRALWQMEQKRDAFHAMALDFERVFFGRRPATDEMFQASLMRFEKEFRNEA